MLLILNTFHFDFVALNAADKIVLLYDKNRLPGTITMSYISAIHLSAITTLLEKLLLRDFNLKPQLPTSSLKISQLIFYKQISTPNSYK